MNDIVLIILIALLVIRNFIRNKETLRELKKLNKTQLLGFTTTLVVTVIISTLLIFYGGNWIAGQLSNIFLKAFSFLVTLFLVFYFVVNLSDKIVNKITNGALPKN